MLILNWLYTLQCFQVVDVFSFYFMFTHIDILVTLNEIPEENHFINVVLTTCIFFFFFNNLKIYIHLTLLH